MLMKCPWPLLSKSGSGNVGLHSVFVVLQYASNTETAFYEGFVSVETNQILEDQILDYLL